MLEFYDTSEVFPQGTEVVLICRDGDEERARRDAEARGYKVTAIANNNGYPFRKDEYLLTKKPEPIPFFRKPRELDGENTLQKSKNYDTDRENQSRDRAAN